MRSVYIFFAVLCAALPVTVVASDSSSVAVPVSRSALVTLSRPMAEVLVADPAIADVHAHSETYLTVVGNRLGRTTVRVFDKEKQLIRDFEVVVGYDLPAIRRALKNFLPTEPIAVEMVNTSVVLSGNISNAQVADRAVKIVTDFLSQSQIGTEQSTQLSLPGAGGQSTDQGVGNANIINMMQVVSGQQVMLRVRIGEINRTAFRTLGVNLNAGNADGISIASGDAGLAGFLVPEDASTSVAARRGLGNLLFPTDSNGVPNNTSGMIYGQVTGGITLAAALQALERDGLFRLLAEPNLVAVSGEEAQFLSGGEIPVPVPQGGSGTSTITIEYRPYGVALKFTPNVLSEARIRMVVQPEVSELDYTNAVRLNNFVIPAFTTRRANTTLEMAPGESFMIAGLLDDRTRSTINQLPGVKELPVLGALFRSTQFQRGETELVIAVTPYIVDPLKSSDVKLPTDDFRQPSTMEMFFYGALSSLSGNARTISQTPTVEGPVGFMVD